MPLFSSPPPAALPRKYASARRAFLAAAENAGAELQLFPHAQTGLEGEPLGIDLALLGPADAEAAVLIVSGTHGVEGYAGSALQTHWLQHHASEAPAGVRTIWLHALNPYGFAWTRRVNEDNVDLNRNFIDWQAPPPTNPGYDAIAEILVPASWGEGSVRTSTGALLARAAEIGMKRMQAEVSQGQFAHPTGVFYGGRGPSWSNDRLRTVCNDTLKRHLRLGIIDLHTGLGEWGSGELIVSQSKGHPAYQRAAGWWGEVHSMVDDDSVSAPLVGDWLERIAEWLPDTEVTSTALEYGTVDPVSVLQSLRADAWLHANGDPKSEEAAVVRSAVRAAFLDDDPAWIAKLWPRFAGVLDAAFEGLRAAA